MVWFGSVIIESALSLSLRDKDRLRDRESLTKSCQYSDHFWNYALISMYHSIQMGRKICKKAAKVYMSFPLPQHWMLSNCWFLIWCIALFMKMPWQSVSAYLKSHCWNAFLNLVSAHWITELQICTPLEFWLWCKTILNFNAKYKFYSIQKVPTS